MIKQNNYANIYMSILGEHIVSLQDKVDKLISLTNSNSMGKEKVAHSNLEHFLEKKFKGGSLNPLKVNNFCEGESSNKSEFSGAINKISEKYGQKPIQRMYYYPRPTPQDMLLEEHGHIITNSYNAKEIYEWNIDGYTDRQIYTTVHRMLVYSTICKTNNNSDKTIADMITAGFTGQLKGRWSDNSETIRTLLQNLRCKTLTSFKFYKDVFLRRVMELPEYNSTH
ncbi:hypothetical protein H5410_060496 [Solanum commersonii]|uniref:DUF7746 domain-containing protein n=1 Tax=Solanum commersonii TaxID=4109 RepID=A0A9J5W5D4_SOLCO|nr:hypothetical protein H5410_060496 [Solanum commersonii]